MDTARSHTGRTTTGKVERSVARLVARAAFATRNLHRATTGLGPRPGLALGMRDLRDASSERAVTPPGGGPSQAVRLGRRETDLPTFIHVFGDRCYAFDPVIDPAWIIDAGANVGYSATWFATTYPRANVIAIEPDEENFRMLVRNTAHQANVVPLRAALSDEPGDALRRRPRHRIVGHPGATRRLTLVGIASSHLRPVPHRRPAHLGLRHRSHRPAQARHRRR